MPSRSLSVNRFPHRVLDSYSPGCPDVETLVDLEHTGGRLARELVVGRRPTLIGPGASITDVTGGGPGIVERVLPDGAVVRFPVTGRVRLMKYWELDVMDVGPDPLHLPGRDTRRQPKGGESCR